VISRIHDRLGTAGFIISIVALIAALGGGAYAASGGLTPKQKKEVKKIAKQFAGKDGAQGPVGAQGPQGATGAQGATGVPGEKGDDGTNGANGANGANGESVSVIPLASGNGSGHCEEGGAKFSNATGEAWACNGELGSGGSGGGVVLPSEQTEAGFWEVLGTSGLGSEILALTTISFPLQVDPPPTEKVLITESSSDEEKAKCPGEGVATPGVLCLYLGGSFSESVTLKPFGGIFKYGAPLFFGPTDEAYGTWAVKAP